MNKSKSQKITLEDLRFILSTAAVINITVARGKRKPIIDIGITPYEACDKYGECEVMVIDSLDKEWLEIIVIDPNINTPK